MSTNPIEPRPEVTRVKRITDIVLNTVTAILCLGGLFGIGIAILYLTVKYGG
jgi:hypothetical protein